MGILHVYMFPFELFVDFTCSFIKLLIFLVAGNSIILLVDFIELLVQVVDVSLDISDIDLGSLTISLSVLGSSFLSFSGASSLLFFGSS
jgi:hypothetical protein